MEIHALHLVISENDLNDLVTKHLPSGLTVENVRVKLSAEGVQVSGVYPFFINVNFETVWLPTIESGKVIVRFVRFKAMGVPGNIFKSALMKMVEDVARKHPWIKVAGDEIVIDPDLACAKYAAHARTNLKSISVEAGTLVIEAGR